MKVIVNGLVTEYKEDGQGPALLMLPGWMNAISNFDALAATLGDSYRIIRLDFSGFLGGGTEAPDTDWGVGEYVNFTEAFIEKIGLTSYTLVGHSFGGRVAIKGTGEGILKPQKLILIAAAGIAKHRTLRNRAFTLLAKVGKLLTLMPPFLFWRKQLRRKMYEFLGSDYLAAGAMSGIYLKAIKEDLQEYARKISVPTLLIWGDKDTNTPLSDGKRFSELIQGSTLEVLPNIGHSPHRDKPEEVAKLIKEFLT